MLDKITLQTKKALYINQIQELKDKDIQVEVDERLASERARLEEEIRKDIEADVKKCEIYLELLDKLIEEANEEEIEENKEEEISTEEINSTDSSISQNDIFQVR